MPQGEPSHQLVGWAKIGVASRTAPDVDAGPSRRCRKASRVASWSAWRKSPWPRVRRPTPTLALRGDADGEPGHQLVGLTEMGLASRSTSHADAGPSRRCRKASRVTSWSAGRKSAWPRVRRPTPTQALRGDAERRAELPAGRPDRNRPGLAFGVRRRRRPFEAMPTASRVTSWSAWRKSAWPRVRRPTPTQALRGDPARRAESTAGRPGENRRGLVFGVRRRRWPFEAMPTASRVTSPSA
jgi:hypothetical protein